MPALNAEVPKAPEDESQDDPDASLRKNERLEEVKDRFRDETFLRKDLEKKRVAAEKNYVNNARNEDSAKQLLPLLEEEITLLGHLSSIHRKTAEGDDFVLAERVMLKRAHLLARYPKLETPDAEKYEKLVQGIDRDTYSEIQKGNVTIRLKPGTEDFMNRMGITITDNGEFFSEKKQKVVLGAEGVDKFIIRSLEGGDDYHGRRAGIHIHKSKPFAFRTKINNEVDEYDHNTHGIVSVLEEDGELVTYAPEKKYVIRESTPPTREQLENVTRYASVEKKIDEPYRTMLHRYDDVPLASLKKEQIKGVIDAYWLSCRIYSDLQESVRRNGKWDEDGEYRSFEEQWKLAFLKGSADDPEDEWAGNRFQEFKDRYNEIVFEEKGYDKLFEKSRHLDFYNSLEVDNELQKLITKAQKQGYSIISDLYRQPGLYIHKDGERIMHFNLNYPDARGRTRKDRSKKALLEEVKKFLKQEVK